jgi:Tol biopolymer transport system component
MRTVVAIAASFALLAPLACSPDSSARHRGLVTAGLASPVAEEIPDSIRTVTRRVWFGPGVFTTGTHPYPDGLTLSLTDWDIGELAIRDLETGETRHLTNHNPSPYETGNPHYSVASPDGSLVAYDWIDWSEAPSSFSLRVMDVATGEEQILWGEPDWWIKPDAWFPDGQSVLARRWNQTTREGELFRAGVEDGSIEVLHELTRSIGNAAVSRDGRFVAFDQRTGPDEPWAIHLLGVADGAFQTLLSGPGDVHLYGWSPNGDQLLYWSDRGGTPGLWIVPVRDGEVDGPAELVLPGAWNLTPVGFTQDDRFFYGVQVGGLGLYVTTLSDDFRTAVSPAVPVTPVTPARVSHPDWSPDGRFLAYVEQRQVEFSVGGPPPDLMVRNVETGEARTIDLGPNLKPNASPRWMPDGHSLLVVATNREGDRGIYRVDPQTGSASMVVTDGVFQTEGSLELTPDGRFLFYKKDVGVFGNYDLRIYRHDLTDGTEVELGGGPLDPDLCTEGRFCMFWDLALSPDGKMLAVNLRTALGVMNVDGSGRRQLIDSPDGEIVSLTWTPDSSALLYTEATDHTVYRIDVVGGEPERVDMGTDELIGGQGFGSLRFHPDGRRIVFVAGEVSGELWLMENFLP